MSGYTRQDRIRNTIIRESRGGGASIVEKMEKMIHIAQPHIVGKGFVVVGGGGDGDAYLVTCHCQH